MEPVGLELCEQRLQVLNVEGTAVLSGIVPVFRKSNLNLVAGQHGRVVRGVAARQHPKTEDSFLERQGRRKVSDGKIHVVALVAPGLFESCLHYGFRSPPRVIVRAADAKLPSDALFCRVLTPWV